MKIEVKTRDGRLMRADRYILASFYVKLFYPEIYSFETNSWIVDSANSDFAIIPMSQIKIIVGNEKARELGGK